MAPEAERAAEEAQLKTSSESKEVVWVAPADTVGLQMHPSMRMRLAHDLEHRPSPYIG